MPYLSFLTNKTFTREIRMDAIAAVADSIQAVNNVLKAASQETINTAKKMLQVETEMKVGPGSGNGNTIDYFA
jgi:hypothetical protein